MIKTNPLSVKDISILAGKVRSEYGISKDEPFPILDYLNNLFDKGLLSIQIIDNNDLYLENNVPAIYNTVDNFIYLKESVLIDYEEKNYRANFTLAHELFHYLQTRVLNFEFEEIEECKSYEEIDWQANEFAGELLLPKEYLDQDDKYLAEHFKVTLECVLTRKLKTKRRNK